MQPWWKEENEKLAAGNMWETCDAIRNNQSSRHENMLKYVRLYSNKAIDSLRPDGYANTVGSISAGMKYNVCRTNVDTLVSKITKALPRPYVLTMGGDFTLQRKGKLLSQFLVGMFYKYDIYKLGLRVFRDTLITGDGFVKLWMDGGELMAERVFPYEIFVDDRECAYSPPKQFYQERMIDKTALIEAFPDSEGAIERGVSSTHSLVTGIKNYATDQIMVREGWFVDDSIGKHCIAIDGACLLLEDYEDQHPPFVHMTYTDPVIGYYGSGLIEKLEPIQVDINITLAQIENIMRLAVPYVMANRASNLNEASLTNTPLRVVYYDGPQPPIIMPAANVPGELFSHLERTMQRAYEETGISQLSAQSRKPAGLNSGAALREYSDIESERFVETHKVYEDFFIRIGKRMIELFSAAEEDGQSISVGGRDKRWLNKISWPDVSMDDDSFELQIYPTSFLPVQPAGRREMISDLLHDGIISQDIARTLYDYPDLDEAMSLELAGLDRIKMQIEAMIEGKEYRDPDPHIDLDLAIGMAMKYYNKAAIDGAGDTVLDKLTSWIDACVTMQQMAAPQQPPEGQQPTQEPLAQG